MTTMTVVMMSATFDLLTSNGVPGSQGQVPCKFRRRFILHLGIGRQCNRSIMGFPRESI